MHKYINDTVFSDNIASMSLQTWDLDTNQFDGELLAGPTPTLFSEDPATSATNIMAYPLKAHWDLSKIAKCFVMPEILTMQEAVAYIKKPK